MDERAAAISGAPVVDEMCRLGMECGRSEVMV